MEVMSTSALEWSYRRRLAGCVMIVAAAFASACEASSNDSATKAGPIELTWQRVADRQGSSMDVPASLMNTSQDDDALVFRSKDGNTVVRFWTMTEPRPGFPGHDPAGDMDLKRSDCDSWPPSYHVVKENMAAYSCAIGGKISYYVAKYAQSGGVAMFAQYPRKQQASWDKVIYRMTSSITQVPRVQAQ